VVKPHHPIFISTRPLGFSHFVPQFFMHAWAQPPWVAGLLPILKKACHGLSLHSLFVVWAKVAWEAHA
jgi:hypothetical protein